MNTITIIGTVTSVIGVAISMYVMWNVRRIKDHFIFQARVPQLFKALRSHADQLSDSLGAFESSHRDIDTELVVIKASLENLKRKVNRGTRKNTEALIALIDRRGTPISKDAAWTIYSDLQALIEELKHMRADSRWEK